MRLRLLLLLAGGLAGPGLHAASRADESFLDWVRAVHFSGYHSAEPAPRWDIPAAQNPAHGEVPVLLRTARDGHPVELGEVRRLYEIDEPFLLVVGFTAGEGANPRLARIAAPAIDRATWRRLWGQVTYADLVKFDELVRDTGRPIEEIRRLALQRRASPPFATALIQVLPRIDAQQRRLVGVIRAEDFNRLLAPAAAADAGTEPALWGVPYPAAMP